MSKDHIIRAIASSQASRGQPVSSPTFRSKPPHQLTADAAPSNGNLNGLGNGANLMVNTLWPSQYQYYFTGILPAEPYLSDPAALNFFWRDIYLYDSVGGSVVDLMLNLPFSDLDLNGIDPDRKRVYTDAVSQLNLRDMFQKIGWSHLVDGFFCGTVIYDAYKKRFSDTMIHDALQCSVRTTPFFNKDPNIQVTVSNAISQFLHNNSEYNLRYINSLPAAFRDLLNTGRFDLNPATTLFIPRGPMTDRPYVSMLHRLLPIYLFEKAMFRGTLTEAQRRQRAMTHVTAGDSDWTPTGQELAALVEQFMAAELDPIGGWVTTRNAVQATDLRPGGDFWKWTDVMDSLVQYKLRSLGVSEAFLGADGVTFQAHESSYSMFLEGLNEFREKLTHRVFYQRIFPMVAIINGFFKDPSLTRGKTFEDYFYNANDRSNLIMPRVHWKKDLQALDEFNTFEMLEKASEHGVPIPLLRYMAAAKIDPEALLRDMDEDVLLRQKIEKVTGKDTSHETDSEVSLGESDYDDFADEGDYHAEASYRRMPTIPLSQYDRHVPKVPLLARFPGSPAEQYDYTRTGKRKAVPSVLQAEKRHKVNADIAKIAATANKDPNYRLDLMKRNSSKLGAVKHKLG